MNFLNTENLSVWFEKFLIDLGVSEFLATVLNVIALLIVYIAFLLIIGYLLIRVFRSFLKLISKSNKVNFQKYLNDTGFARYLVYLVLLLVVRSEERRVGKGCWGRWWCGQWRGVRLA